MFRGIAVCFALSLLATPALASVSHTPPTPAKQVEPARQDTAWGFYTCVHVMYNYGKNRYGNRVSDNVLFQAAVDTCSGAV